MKVGGGGWVVGGGWLWSLFVLFVCLFVGLFVRLLVCWFVFELCSVGSKITR